jgi:hypothetical protein
LALANLTVAKEAGAVTVKGVGNREVHAKVLPTPFVSSFVGRARQGSLHDQDPARRACAWATWAVDSIEEFKGFSDRHYVGLVLPGRFHDMNKNAVQIRPHIEIPRRVLETPDPEFPDRLAAAGNALEFPWWVISEVTALRRAVFNTPPGSIADLLNAINSHRGSLLTAVEEVNATLGRSWSLVEERLVSSPASLLPFAVGDFATSDIEEFFPPARSLNMRIVYDRQLLEQNNEWSTRRVGVWQIVVDSPTQCALGVLTPRLTRNSLFVDPQFLPQYEATASLLVRALVLRRLLKGILDTTPSSVLSPDPLHQSTGGPYLRAVPARPGAKLPEASIEAAVHFLQHYPDGENAWAALTRWAGEAYLLTVSHDGFLASHRNALRYVRRAETPEREDINVLLPLAWADGSKVVRVTFSRPVPSE